MAQLKRDTWNKRTRMSRLASVLYPHLADEETRREMKALARREGKRAPQEVKPPGYVGPWSKRGK